MRIRRLDLVRYGKFTNQSLDFPRSEFDFHMIFGPNEAGKSTVRHAIADLLYGISRTSPFNFVHEYTEMCIGALVESDGQSLDFQRLKRNKGSLVDSAGNALPNNVLVPFLGGTDQDFFLRMFAIDHQNMVRGGKEILNTSGDLGQMLFQAAAGLGSFQAIKEKLETEADGLWGPKAKGSRAYNQALGRMEEAKARVQEVRVTSHKWTTARRALDTADSELTKAQAKLTELSILCDQLERVQRASPQLAQLHDAQDRTVAMGPVTRLPANASASLGTAEIEIEAARAQAQIHERTIEEAERDLVNFMPDAPMLVHAVEIRRLAGLVANVQQAERDIPKRQSEVAEQTRQLLNAADQVGWIGIAPEDIPARLPRDLLRAEIDDLLKRHSSLVNELDRRTSEVAQAKLALKVLDDEEAALPVAVEHAALGVALKAAQSLNHDERDEELLGALNAAKRKLDQALLDLAPWSGDAVALASTTPFDMTEIQRLLDGRTRVEADLIKIRQGIGDRQLNQSGLETELLQERRDHHLATAEELTQARQRRDASFEKIVTGEMTASSAESAYGDEVKMADTLADRRYEEAEDTARLQALANRCEQLRTEINQLVGSEERCVRQLADQKTEWKTRATELGIVEISVDRVTSWSQQRGAALAAASDLELARERMATFATRAEACSSLLRAELVKASAPAQQETDLSALITLAVDVLTAAVQNRTRREFIDKRRNECSSKLQTAQVEAKRAQEGMEAWEIKWVAKVAEAHLHSEASQVAVSKAMELFRTMDTCQEKILDLEEDRIGTMHRDIDQFKAGVDALVAACALDLIQKPATDAASLLVIRLEKAHADKTAHIRLSGDIVKAKAKLEESTQKRILAEAKLKPLFDQAAVSDIEALRDAIGRSDKALGLDREAKEHRAAAIAGGGGMALEDLEKEVANFDLTQLVTQIETTSRQLDDITKVRDVWLERRALAQADYSQIAGTDEAAKAESRRHTALAEMGAAADEYIQVSTGARLLKWALERYREEKQGPLLASASEFFSRLTNGEHAKLLVETGDSLRLISRKADGSKVGVAEMSDGTSDQLYLALRLAALKLHVGGGTSLPFVADDLLINCDDKRATSAFGAFAHLATNTQVLYFTHHQHLIDIARDASDNRVNVVEIS